MAPMIAGLSDQDIEDISAYYAIQVEQRRIRERGDACARRAHLPRRQRGVRGARVHRVSRPQGRRQRPGRIPGAWPASTPKYTAKQIDDWRLGNRSNDPERR